MGNRLGRLTNFFSIMYGFVLPFVGAVICVAFIMFVLFTAPYFIGVWWMGLSLDIALFVTVLWGIALGSFIAYRQLQFRRK